MGSIMRPHRASTAHNDDGIDGYDTSNTLRRGFNDPVTVYAGFNANTAIRGYRWVMRT